MATKFIKLNTSIFICLAVAAASFYVGYEVAMSLEPSCEGCFSTCEDELKAAEEKLERAYVIPESGPTRAEIDKATAKDLMKNFADSDFATIHKFRGMNLHLNHLEQMIRYHLDLGSSAHGGFRVYNGLVSSGTSTAPTAADIRQIIIPLAADGKEIMPTLKVWSFDPNDMFELPCPTLCD